MPDLNWIYPQDLTFFSNDLILLGEIIIRSLVKKVLFRMRYYNVVKKGFIRRAILMSMFTNSMEDSFHRWPTSSF